MLTHPPKPSETFLTTFIYLVGEKNELVLFLSQKAKFNSNLSQFRYLNKSNLFLVGLQYLFKWIVYINRFNSLKRETPIKLLIHDIPIWTHRNLDYLHFAFGNLAFGRENYSNVMGCKMSVSFRGSDINVYPKWHQLTYKTILEKCDKIQCNSKMLKDELLKHNDQVDPKIVIIPPGLQAEFHLKSAEIEELNRKRWRNNYTIFVSIGRLHWVKGFEKVLEALSKLKQSQIDFEYHIIGQGPEQEKLVFLTHFFGINENVKFLGLKSPKEIRTHLEESNVFIQTSWAEGFSNSTMEAQALGLPVIVTPISGMDEIVLHKQTGYIADSHSPEDILAGINWYYSLSNDQKMEMGKRAQERILDNFSMHKLRNNWNHFFNNQ